tara:strand:- start:279 stop:389 length:111 start_codon:yes stop_codon:yes gene_type:complete
LVCGIVRRIIKELLLERGHKISLASYEKGIHGKVKK